MPEMPSEVKKVIWNCEVKSDENDSFREMFNLQMRIENLFWRLIWKK